MPADFSAFLKLLNKHDVRYLLVGGYAVGYHGHVRATADLDVWVKRSRQNGERLVKALRAFGFDVPALEAALFTKEHQVIRMGVPPVRLEVITSASGVDFETCYAERVTETIDDTEISLISLRRLKENKRASGRTKDLNDLENLP